MRVSMWEGNQCSFNRNNSRQKKKECLGTDVTLICRSGVSESSLLHNVTVAPFPPTFPGILKPAADSSRLGWFDSPIKSPIEFLPDPTPRHPSASLDWNYIAPFWKSSLYKWQILEHPSLTVGRWTEVWRTAGVLFQSAFFNAQPLPSRTPEKPPTGSYFREIWGRGTRAEKKGLGQGHGGGSPAIWSTKHQSQTHMGHHMVVRRHG